MSVPVGSDTVYLGALPLVYGSVQVYSGSTPINSGYIVNYTDKLMVLDTSIRQFQLTVFYRVLNWTSNSVFSHKPDYLIEPTFNGTPRYLYSYDNTASNSRLFSDGLNVNGNIARGIGFGNNQDVVLNSNLNLQLNGKLGKGISILAAISDENNPIQPEGNTQQIQDFDKVFISIFKDSNSLTVGDFLMTSSPSSYFMKYYKKSRGLQLDINDKGKVAHHLHADAAVSRGKFVRNEIQGVEGNQGPYRLQGANGELNIIVISATEVVYLDGEKLERGQQNDYVIDYNTGEISFMPKRLITQFNRIVVEFQYSDRNYARSVFTISDEIKVGKFSTAIRYYTEQDNKLQPTDTSNSSDVQKILAAAGDNPATFNYEKRYNQYQFDRVNYRRIDSLGYNILLYSNAPESDTAFYTAVFSLVGPNKGNYIQVASSANGRVYAWVAPINNVPQGSYEPYVTLVAPKRMQMLSASAMYKASDKFDVKTEAAYSNFNTNTYSDINKSNDDGLGLFLSLNQRNLKFKKINISSQLKSEFISSGFSYVERYRSVEFNRVWNRRLNNSGSLSVPANELVSAFNSQINLGKAHHINIELGNFNRRNNFNGFRGAGAYRFSGSALTVNINGEQIASKTKGIVNTSNSSYLYKLETQYLFKKLKTSVSAQTEESRFSSDTASQLDFGSFRYQQLAASIQGIGSKVWNYKLEGSYRSDDVVNLTSFKYNSSGVNMNANLEHTGPKQNRLSMVGSFRKFNVAGSATDEEVVLGRIEYNAAFLKRIISSSTYYQIGTGREQKRTFSFALVQSGNGTHTWVDYNKNGIEEINEFEPAIYADQAKYVKVWLPSNEFIKSNTNEFNQTLRLQAPQAWQSANAFKRFVARFNTISAFKADRRITDNSLLTIINPLQLEVSDSSLIAVNSLIKQTTFFNRSSAKFGIEHTIQTNKGKQFLNSGFEWKQFDKNQLITRLGIGKQFSLVLDLEQSRKQNRNDFFENRNYNYTAVIAYPELFFQTVKGFRAGTYFKYTEAINAPQFGNDQAYINEYGLELRYFIINKGNIDAKIASHQISFTGNPNTPLAFDVLNGLSNGQNITWKMGFGGKAKGNIQFNISYEGRKTQINKAVHIGRAEARYVF